MKSTVLFKQTIKDYLDERAKTDKLFALNYAKANKSIDECITFIFQEVQKSGGASILIIGRLKQHPIGTHKTTTTR